MDETYICHFDVENLEQLLDAADALRDNSDEFPTDTVYIWPTRFTLFEETLSDGSTVKNIRIKSL